MLRYAIVHRFRQALFPVGVLSLLAFALRVFRIEQQSLWYDEAFSVYLARFDLGEITARTAADIQPPLYYYLLHFWMMLAGDSEFAVRFLSLFFGVLTVPLLYVTARRLFNPTAGLFAALLACLSPLYVWYSQETRMYTLITFLGLLSSYALLRALAGGRRNWWLTFVLANIAAVYTHYFAFAIIAFQFIYAIWVLVTARRAPHALRNTFLSFAVILLAFLPWVPFMLNRLGEDASYFRGALKLDEAIRHIFINFATGESVLENIAQYIAATWLVVLVVGLIAWLIARRRDPQVTQIKLRASALIFAVLYLLVPLALLLFLFSRNPKFNARYLMIASPGLLLLLGAGLAGLWMLLQSRNPVVRVVSGAALVLAALTLFGTSLYAVNNAYFDPAFTKADFRGVASYIAAHAGNDEAIILTSGHMFPAFDYYYRDAELPELRLPDDPTLNADHVLNFAAANDMNRGLAGKRGAWLVEWQVDVVDPNSVVPMLLSTRGAEQKQDAAFWQVKLRHWTLPDAFAPFSAQPEIANPHEANFANRFKLLGWSQPQPLPADQGASVRLYWQALDAIPDDYNVALRIVDDKGNFWGKVDRRPAGYNYPTTRWNKGDTVFGDYVATLLPGTPAGDYFVTATLFTQQDQTGLNVLAANGAPLGKSVKIGPIKILPAEKQPALTDLNIQHSLSAPAPPFTLLGYQIGAEKASTGESIPVTLFWRADQKPDADYTFQIRFGDKLSAPLPLANAAYPTSQWDASFPNGKPEIVRGQFLVQIPPDASSSNGNLQLQLSGGGKDQVIDLVQPFAVEKTDRVFTAPEASYKQDANFNNLIALAGYNLSAPQVKAGDMLTITLNWKALAKPDKDYTVFVHLLDKNSQPVAQKDSQPLNGARKTTTWVEGEYLADAYPLALKPDTPPGDYQIEIGWYDAADPAFARIQVLDENGSGAGDRVILNTKVELK